MMIDLRGLSDRPPAPFGDADPAWRPPADRTDSPTTARPIPRRADAYPLGDPHRGDPR